MVGWNRLRGWGVTAGVATGLAAAGPSQAQPHPSVPEAINAAREFTTDRPDTTESPYTVPPGLLQAETTLYGFTRSRRDASGLRTDTQEAGTTNLRIGLTSILEADVVVQPYEGVSGPDGAADAKGPGDLTLRAKLNLLRPDGVKQAGQVALGVLPFVDIPLDRGNGISSDGVGGGVILPVDVSLGGPFSLGLNAGVHVAREDRARGYEPQVLLSASLGQDWNERLGTFYEIAAVVNRGDPAGRSVSFNTGVTCKVARAVQIDAGVNLGVTRGADPVAAFVGVSARF